MQTLKLPHQKLDIDVCCFFFFNMTARKNIWVVTHKLISKQTNKQSNNNNKNINLELVEVENTESARGSRKTMCACEVLNLFPNLFYQCFTTNSSNNRQCTKYYYLSYLLMKYGASLCFRYTLCKDFVFLQFFAASRMWICFA